MYPIQAPLRICILESISTETVQYPTYIAPYLPEHYCEHHKIALESLESQLAELIAKRFDVFINLCDGAAGSGSAGIEVVRYLEQHGAAYTGADEHFYEPTRQQMKDACKLRGIRVPNYAFAGTET